MKILITGDAGFIGFHLAKRLIKEKIEVIGLDNLNPYYDVNLKKSRREELKAISKLNGNTYEPLIARLESDKDVVRIFEKYQPEKVVHLAAQAGVRYSIENPSAYIQSNLVGFTNIIECCRKFNINNFIYASSSSVYGGNRNMPFSEHHNVDHPVSLYAATKKSNELIAHSYSHLYQIPSIGLRFFTVYGPWGRPDMALFLFTKAILDGQTIKVFNNGNMTRDFTYIDDIVESLFRLLNKPANAIKNFDYINPDPATSWAPHRVFNIGNSKPTPLLDYIEAIEESLGIKAKKEFLPLQPGDVPSTSASTIELESWINFKPNTEIKIGVANFINWYKNFYSIN